MGVFEDVRQRDTRGLEHQRFRFRSQRQSRCNVQIHVDARGRECGNQVGKNRNKVGASLNRGGSSRDGDFELRHPRYGLQRRFPEHLAQFGRSGPSQAIGLRLHTLPRPPFPSSASATASPRPAEHNP